MIAQGTTRVAPLLPGFINDCLECGCDIGTYAKGALEATNEQLAELRDRAEHYAHGDGPDCCPAGLKTAARALLSALARRGR